MYCLKLELIVGYVCFVENMRKNQKCEENKIERKSRRKEKKKIEGIII